MFWKLLFADIKMMVRNRQALFWAFMFPLLFSFMFGFFFGKDAKNGTVAIVNHSDSQISTKYVEALEEAEIYKVEKDLDIDEARAQIKSGKIVAAVEIPEGFGDLPEQKAPQVQILPNGQVIMPEKVKIPEQKMKLVIDPGNAQINAGLTGFTDKFLSQLNLKIQGADEVFLFEEEKTNDKKLSYYDFILAGILGLSVMNSSVIGIAVSMSKYRVDKILKRITTTPVPTWAFILAEVISRLMLNLAQIAVILAIGIYMFDANIYGNVYVLVGVAMLGALLFQLLGFVIASLSKTTDAAQGMGTAITIPMMFLGGVFFPIDSLPRWLFSIVQYLPLSPLLRILRGVSSEGLSPFSNPQNIYIVSAWIVAALLFSVWKFRLTDE